MMRCIAPDTVTEGALLAYVEAPSAAPDALQTHLVTCQHCQGEVKQLTLLNAFFSPLPRLDCPLPSALLAYAAHLSPLEARAQVETHLATCAHCPLELKVMQNATGLETDALAAPFLQVWTQLVQEGRRVVEAILKPSQTLAPALRGGEIGSAPGTAGPSLPQTWVYELPECALVLTLHPPSALDPQARLEGQLTPWPPESDALDASDAPEIQDPPPALARLHVPDAAPLEAEIDLFGYFSLTPTASNATALERLHQTPLELRWESISVLLPSLSGSE